jgi:hypothetical protein
MPQIRRESLYIFTRKVTKQVAATVDLWSLAKARGREVVYPRIECLVSP